MKQKLLRLLSMLSIMVLYCSTAGAITNATLNQLTPISSNHAIIVETAGFTLTDGKIANGALSTDKTMIVANKGTYTSGYSVKKGTWTYNNVDYKGAIQVKGKARAIAFKVTSAATITIFHNSEASRVIVASNKNISESYSGSDINLCTGTVNTTSTTFSVSEATTIMVSSADASNVETGTDMYIFGVEVKFTSESAVSINIDEAERNLTTEINTPTTLRATVTGNPDPTMQWYQCEDAEKTNPVAIVGATNATYDFTPTATGTYYFYCVAKNTLTEGGEQTAISEVITVNAVDKLPSSDTSIGSISVGEINLAVSSSTIDYTAYVLNVGDNISVTVTPADENASVVDGNTFMVTSGEKKEFKIKAEDGTEKTYSITATNINDETTSNNYYYVQKKDYLAGQKIVARDITALISPTASNVGAKMNTDDSKTSTLNNQFAVHISGSVNPSNNSSTGVPTNGAYFSFTPTKSGKLNVAIFLNADKELWVSNGTKRMVAGTDFTSEFASNQELTNNKITAATYGNLFFAVEANTTYYVYCTGSKVMFGGFIFTPSNQTIGISASHGYTSYCSEYALDFTDVKALEAYVAYAAANGVVRMKNVQKVPANTGLVLKSTSGAAVSDVQVPVIESADAVGANLLVGTLAATTVDPSSDTNGYNYLFGTKNDVLGFYKLITNTFEMPANKAYLHTTADVTPASSGAKGVIMDFGNGETTAISNIDADADNNAIYYNLNGQRVVNPGKGLYILNGKKVMVK